MIPRYAPTYSYADLFRSLPERGSEALCAELKNYYRVKHVFLVDSARVALYILLKAYHRPGGVLLPAYNCIVVPEAILFAGYRPMFVDIDPCTLNMTAAGVEEALTPEVSVILATHLFGIPCELADLGEIARRANVLLVEDAAPAIGAEYHGQLVGTFGAAAMISFQSTKVISGMTGGALLTNDDDLAAQIAYLIRTAAAPRKSASTALFLKALLRKVGMDPRVYPITQAGYRALRREQMYEVVYPEASEPADFLKRCSHLDSNLVAGQFASLERNLARRRALADLYSRELAHCEATGLPDIPADCQPAWIQYPIRVKDKPAFYHHMQREGIDLSWTYRYSCAESYQLAGFSNACQAARSVLGLPTYPALSDRQALFICEAAKGFLAN